MRTVHYFDGTLHTQVIGVYFVPLGFEKLQRLARGYVRTHS